MPERTEEDESARERESRDFDLDGKSESANHQKRTEECERNLDEAHDLLWGRFQLTLCD